MQRKNIGETVQSKMKIQLAILINVCCITIIQIYLEITSPREKISYRS